jgi:uncharacterized membrane protein
MRKTILTALVSVTLAAPAFAAVTDVDAQTYHLQHQKLMQVHQAGQSQENPASRQSLQGQTTVDKSAAVQANRGTPSAGNPAFNDQIHRENMMFLREKLSANKKFTDAQKAEILNFYEQQYQENAAFGEQRHVANTAFFELIAGDSSLTLDQRKAAIRNYFQEQKALTQHHRTDQQAENKAVQAPVPSKVPVPVQTVEPAQTVEPTQTAAPTQTAEPTETAEPAETAK